MICCSPLFLFFSQQASCCVLSFLYSSCTKAPKKTNYCSRKAHGAKLLAPDRMITRLLQTNFLLFQRQMTTVVQDFIPAILLTTTETEEEAVKISNKLIQSSLAACVQIKPVKSYYMWESKMESSEEFQLTIKCCLNHFERLETVIKQNHSYDVPQIVCYKLDKCSNSYLQFMKIALKLMTNDTGIRHLPLLYYINRIFYTLETK